MYIQEQTESEYKQFLDEHKDMLDKALKKAREQHNQDKSELEERFNTQMKLLQAREKSLQEQLRKALEGSQEHNCCQSEESSRGITAELEKEQVQWFEERNRLLQDISDRDSLLGKADQRLEREINSSRQKLEAEYSRANNSEQKEKLQLEKQLSEVNSEVGKLKATLTKEKEKSAEELDRLITEKVEDKNRLEGELKKAKELLKGFKDELTETQGKCEKYKQECDELNIKLSKGVQNQEKLQAELQKVKEDRSTNVESAQNLETSYRKEIASCTQRLEELSARNSKMEKLLKDMKHKYRQVHGMGYLCREGYVGVTVESLRKALEAENEVAMNAMKTKMIELQKKHFTIVDELKRKHLLEKEALLKHGQAAGVGRGITPTPNVQGEVEEIDKTVTELRSQYLDTVAKIKDDVLRHITQTNVRAAETVKIEMDRERMTTFQQIKDFYRQNVRTILETELVGYEKLFK
ncbi:hypothetical protein DPMN_031187 [Dreissena polymorpha]|uniref:CEP152 CEP63 binding coiled coil domain-containing protein n=1 Tax=Dreissena polymorpha TaxID=45954 RepID=A0A9D4RGV8_DREPO|nr:hypothetical protein DPMN_031187 [Dreissena polymorpha]